MLGTDETKVMGAKSLIGSNPSLYTMLVSLGASLVVSLVAVWRELNPKWHPNLSELGTTLRYGFATIPAS